MKHRGLVRRAAAMAAVVVFTLAAAPPVAAFSITNATPIWSQCSSNLPWSGSVPYSNAADGQYFQSLGTVKWCFWAYKGVEQAPPNNDPGGDYYIVFVRATWTTSQSYSGDNYAKVVIASTIPATGYVYESLPDGTVSVNSGCTTLSLSVGWFVYAGVNPTLCSGGRINRDSFTTSSVQYSSPDIARTPKWEVAYMVKVPEGAKPRLYASFTFPSYTIYRDSNLYWRYTKHYSGELYGYQTR